MAINDYLNIQLALNNRNESPKMETNLPGIVVTPNGVGHDNTVYDNKEMLPKGWNIDPEKLRYVQGLRGARYVNQAQTRAVPFVLSTVGAAAQLPFVLTSVPMAASYATGTVGGYLGGKVGKGVDKIMDNKVNWGEGIGQVAGGLVGGFVIPGYNFIQQNFRPQKINYLDFNPYAMYRIIGRNGYKEALETRLLKPNTGKGSRGLNPNLVFYTKGRPNDRWNPVVYKDGTMPMDRVYPGDIIVEVSPGHTQFQSFVPHGKSAINPIFKTVGKENYIRIDDPHVRFGELVKGGKYKILPFRPK